MALKKKKKKYEPKRLAKKDKECDIVELQNKKSTGLFSKFMVVYCLLFVSVASVYTFYLIGNRGVDANATLTVVCGLFGAELLLLCMKRIFQKTDKKDAQLERLITKLVEDKQNEENGNNSGNNNNNVTTNNTFSSSLNEDLEFDEEDYEVDSRNFDNFVNKYKYLSNGKAKDINIVQKTKDNLENIVAGTSGSSKDNKKDVTSNITNKGQNFETSNNIDNEISDIFGSGGLVTNADSRVTKENKTEKDEGIYDSADWYEESME